MLKTIIPRRERLFVFNRKLFFSGSVNSDEIRKFSFVGENWWDSGSSSGTGPLHDMNPVRINFIRNSLALKNGTASLPPSQQIAGISILDVGCGGGLLAESLARLGATVTAVDPSIENIAVAERHSTLDPATVNINFLCSNIEDLFLAGKRFDVITCLEVIEHVDNPADFVLSCAKCLNPGGSMFLSTMNRTAASFAVTIVAAEYLLKLLPIGTHDWNKFVTPEEMTRMVTSKGCNMHIRGKAGMIMRPDITKRNLMSWHLSESDLNVNYIVHAIKIL